MDYLLRIGAVWFDGTILDTNDISTVRGSSLALLFVPDRLKTHLENEFENRVIFSPIISGASILVLGCTLRDANASLAGEIRTSALNYLNNMQELVAPGPGKIAEGTTSLPLNNFRFTVNLVAAGEAQQGHKDMARLQALANHQQYQLASIQVPPNPQVSHLPKSVCAFDGVSPTNEAEAGNAICESVKLRRQFGRERKRDFYF